MTKLKGKAIWIVSGDLMSRGLSFVASIYLARTLGTENYGLIVFGISVLGYANWFSDMGLFQIGTRETARLPEKRIYRIIEIFGLKLILGFTVLFFSLLLLLITDIPVKQKHVLFGFLISLLPQMFLMEWFYAGKQEFEKITLSKALQGSIYLALILFMIKSSDDVTLVPVFYTAGILCASITLGVFAIRDKPFTLPSRGKQIFPELFNSTYIIGLGQLSAQIIQLLPPILVGFFLSFAMTGIYGAAFKVVLLAMLIDRLFVQLLVPNLSSIWSKSKVEAKKKLQMIFRIMLCIGAVFALFFALSAEQIILWLFGNDYSESITLLKILSVLIGATFINSLFSFGLIATNHDSEFFKATLFGGISSAVLMILSAYYGNIITVTVSVVLSEIVITGFTYYQFNKTFRHAYLKQIALTSVPALLLFLLFFKLPIAPLLSASIACLILIIALEKLKIIHKTDINWLKHKLIP